MSSLRLNELRMISSDRHRRPQREDDQHAVFQHADDKAPDRHVAALACWSVLKKRISGVKTMASSGHHDQRDGDGVAGRVVVEALTEGVHAERQRGVRRTTLGQTEDDVEDAECVHAADDGDDDQHAGDQRQRDLEQRAQRAGAVDLGRLVDLGRDRGEAGGHDQQHEGRGLPDIDHHDAEQRPSRLGQAAEDLRSRPTSSSR